MLKLHVELDRFDRGIVLWVVRADLPIGHYLPGNDPHGMARIDEEAVANLLELLELAESGDWGDSGADADGLAHRISSCLQRVEETLPEGFDEPSELVIPNPLAKELRLDAQPIQVSAWLRRFPPAG